MNVNVSSSGFLQLMFVILRWSLLVSFPRKLDFFFSAILWKRVIRKKNSRSDFGFSCFASLMDNDESHHECFDRICVSVCFHAMSSRWKEKSHFRLSSYSRFIILLLFLWENFISWKKFCLVFVSLRLILSKWIFLRQSARFHSSVANGFHLIDIVLSVDWHHQWTVSLLPYIFKAK